MPHRTFSAVRWLAAAPVLAAAACSGELITLGGYLPPPPPPFHVLEFVGLPSTSEVGSAIEIRVMATSGGIPARGVSVSFGASGDAAVVNPRSAETDSAGLVVARWTLDTIAGLQAIGASWVLASSAGASVTAVAGPATRMAAATPTDQIRAAGAWVSVGVDLFDRFGNPAKGAVTFEVAEGGGSLIPQSLTSAQWQVGSDAGEPQRVDARLGAAPALSFRVTAFALTLTVVSPGSGDRFITGDTIQLTADAASEAALVADSVRWFDNGALIGRGFSMTMSSLEPGTHVVEVRAYGARSFSLGFSVFENLGTLYRHGPSASEIARIKQDFEITYVDGTGPDETWAAYPDYTHSVNTTSPSRLTVIARLDVLRRQRFEHALPFTGGRSVYDWVRANVRTIQLRLDCNDHTAGAGVISFSRTMSHWDGRGTDCKEPLPGPAFASFLSLERPLETIVHQTRHNEPGDPGHTTCADGAAGDAFFENGSGHATGALYAMWLYKYSLYDDIGVTTLARLLARTQLGRICTAPTHSDPRVQALLREILIGG